MDRREFLALGAGAAAALSGAARSAGAALSVPAAQAAGGPRERPKKAVILGMIRGASSLEEKFEIIKKAGFDGVEVPPTFNPEEQARYRATSEKVGLPIHSIIYGGWNKLLSAADPKDRETAVEDLKKGLRCAQAVGADNLLLVPARVDAKTRYVDAYQRSQESLGKAVPVAEELKVVISVEEVWNNFLLSPLEFCRYVDEFKSPWVKAYFDVGNIVKNGWPEDWIRTLGPRINRVHLKDYRKKTGTFVKLMEGDVDWAEVRKAFREVGFSKFMTAEFNGDDFLEPDELARRIDQIIDG